MPNLASGPHFRLRGRISSSGPNFVFAAEFLRLQDRAFVFSGRVSSVGPNLSPSQPKYSGAFNVAVISRLQRTEFRFQDTLSISVFLKPNFRLQYASNRISSSEEFRLHDRF